MRHEPVRRIAVPVLFVRLKSARYRRAESPQPDRPLSVSDQRPRSLDDLAERVPVPRRSCARREVHVEGGEPGGRRGASDLVEPYLPGEPVGWATTAVPCGTGDLHAFVSSLSGSRSTAAELHMSRRPNCIRRGSSRSTAAERRFASDHPCDVRNNVNLQTTRRATIPKRRRPGKRLRRPHVVTRSTPDRPRDVPQHQPGQAMVGLPVGDQDRVVRRRLRHAPEPRTGSRGSRSPCPTHHDGPGGRGKSACAVTSRPQGSRSMRRRAWHVPASIRTSLTRQGLKA